MALHIKHFTELSLEELYGLLQLRSEVFVVEQSCVYQDLDGNDRKAYHVFLEQEGTIRACARFFLKNPREATIGRVVACTQVRGTGAALRLMCEAIRSCREHFPGLPIVIHAQSYAKGFYQKCGFQVTSKEFLEDLIPHVEMTLMP